MIQPINNMVTLVTIVTRVTIVIDGKPDGNHGKPGYHCNTPSKPMVTRVTRVRFFWLGSPNLFIKVWSGSNFVILAANFLQLLEWIFNCSHFRHICDDFSTTVRSGSYFVTLAGEFGQLLVEICNCSCLRHICDDKSQLFHANSIRLKFCHFGWQVWSSFNGNLQLQSLQAYL